MMAHFPLHNTRRSRWISLQIDLHAIQSIARLVRLLRVCVRVRAEHAGSCACGVQLVDIQLRLLADGPHAIDGVGADELAVLE